jgi:anti-sigma factor RsiW
MTINENDLDLLQEYLDGEMRMAECEGLWRRLSVEPELAAELDRLRADAAIRQVVWSSLEPDESAAVVLESRIMRASRRHDLMAGLQRGLTIATTAAACILFGFTVGWFGREHNPAGAAGGSPNVVQVSNGQPEGGRFVVDVRDGGGSVKVPFDTLEEAKQFEEDFAQSHNDSQDSRDSVVVPTVGKF